MLPWYCKIARFSMNGIFVKLKNLWKSSRILRIAFFLCLFLIVAAAAALIYFLIIMPQKADRPLTKSEVEEEIETIMSSFDEENPESFNSVEQLVDLGQDAIPKLLEKAEDDDLHTQWASLYALSRLGYDSDTNTKAGIITVVKGKFENESASIKVMAAGIAVVLGEKSGIPVLIESLSEKDMLLLTEPPELICQYSYSTLQAYTKQSFGTMCDWDNVDEEGLSKWQAWWEDNQHKLIWNEEDHIYKGE